jgi:hypothetical protein
MAQSKKPKKTAAKPVASTQASNQEKHIAFDYEKSKFFRVIRVDGVIGGPAPKGDGIQMGLFSERVPIPTHEEYHLGSDGKIGELIDRKGRSKVIFREVEVEAMIPLDVAKSLQDWLSKSIELLEGLRAKGTANVK